MRNTGPETGGLELKKKGDNGCPFQRHYPHFVGDVSGNETCPGKGLLAITRFIAISRSTSNSKCKTAMLVKGFMEFCGY